MPTPNPTRFIARNRNNPAAFYTPQKAEDSQPVLQPANIDGKGAPQIAPPPGYAPTPDTSPPPEIVMPDAYNRGDNQMPPPPAAPGQTTPAYNPDAGSALDNVRGTVSDSLTAPYLAQLELNRKKRAALKTMPITDKDGNTTGGWEAFGNDQDPNGDAAKKKYTDTNGRWKSGASAFLQSLAANPGLRNVRSWGELANAVTYSAAAGVAGGIHSSWDEQQKRDRELAKLDQEDARIKSEANENIKLANSQSVIDNRSRTANRQDRMLDERVNQNKINTLGKEKVDFLKPILNRGYFYEADATDAEKAEMQRLGITLPDFDKTRPAYNDKGGIRKVWDVEHRAYVPAAGDEPDEPLVPAEIDGVRLNLTPGQFANYKAQESKTNYQTSVRDADNEQEFNDNLTKWKADEQKRQADNIKLTNDGNTKHTEYLEAEKTAADYEAEAERLKDDNPGEAVKMRSAARAARTKAAALKTEGEGMLNRARNSKELPKPVKQAALPTYNSPVKTTPPPGTSKGGKNDNIGTPKNYADALRKIRGY